MNFFEYKKEIEKIFKNNNIDKNEVNILFCEAMNLSFAEMLKIENLSQKDQTRLDRYVKLRLKGKPIQKIFKRAYFFDYVFYVNQNVLCPRPETELLVEEALKFAKSNSKILDLCTGSGAIAITIQKKSNAKVSGSDISKKALYVAKKNAKMLNANVKFVLSDMFENISGKFDMIVSNPPYIPSKEIESLDIEVKKFDPIISLDGGVDGLDFYKQIAQNARNYLNKNGKLLLEVGKGQAKKVKQMLEKNGFACFVKNDYNNIERIVVGELK